MRIARIGNLYQPIPATEYGGTQRSMAQMTAFQAAICAHDITLYASADSTIISFTRDISEKLGLNCEISSDGSSIRVDTADGQAGRVKLKSAGISSLRYEDSEEGAKHRQLFAALRQDEIDNPFDIIHCHHRRYMSASIKPAGLLHKTLTHQHNAVLEASYQQWPYPLICISHEQARLMQKKYKADVYGVVHHGLDSYTHVPTTEHAGYLAWIGRFLPDKGADRSIRIAQEAGLPLVIAGVVYEKDPESRSHFSEKIRPQIDVDDPSFLTRLALMSVREVRNEITHVQRTLGKSAPIIFAGAADDQQKQALYGNALATLFPISWPEPFGRVMIESMACGTPVIAYKSIGKILCGAVNEVIDHGSSGFALAPKDETDGIFQAVAVIRTNSPLDRVQVRRVFDEKWTSQRVALQVDTIYRRFMHERMDASILSPVNGSHLSQPNL